MEFMYVMKLWRALISKFVRTSAEVKIRRNYLSLTPSLALLLLSKPTMGSIPARCVGEIYTFELPSTFEFC